MSKREAEKAWELDQLIKTGDVLKWERQQKIELFGQNGSHICNYFIDFVIYWKDGTIEYCEVKGFKTEVWRLKWKLFEDKFGKDHRFKLTIEY